MWLIKRNILLIILALGSFVAIGQNKNELESQKKQLLRDIEFTNKLLNETEANKKATLGELNLLSSKINKRQQLINTILREVDYVQAQINVSCNRLKTT
jgi:septal ring factor EnvC (AmiA/AmiB activator)